MNPTYYKKKEILSRNRLFEINQNCSFCLKFVLVYFFYHVHISISIETCQNIYQNYFIKTFSLFLSTTKYANTSSNIYNIKIQN